MRGLLELPQAQPQIASVILQGHSLYQRNNMIPTPQELDKLNTVELYNLLINLVKSLDTHIEPQDSGEYLSTVLKERAERLQSGLNYYSTSTSELDKPYRDVLKTVNMSFIEFKTELLKLQPGII